jgi:hypothetical protein
MKPYMAFSRAAGPQEGAFLVVADNIREAKKLAWRQCPMDFMEYTDLGIKLMGDANGMALADLAKVAAGIPHVVPDPVGCEACQMWGAGLTADNLCADCGEHPGAKLLYLCHRRLNDEK